MSDTRVIPVEVALLTIAQAARFLACSRRTVNRLIACGEPPSPARVGDWRWEGRYRPIPTSLPRPRGRLTT
jgi:excisionase family DNA binding protein